MKDFMVLSLVALRSQLINHCQERGFAGVLIVDVNIRSLGQEGIIYIGLTDRCGVSGGGSDN